MNNFAKCTYIVTTDNQLAPGFKVDANTMTGFEIYYIELSDPNMLVAGYTFSYFPDPTNVVYYRNYDQSAILVGGGVASYSLRLNTFVDPVAKYV